MAKKKKVRVEFRRNRTKPPRENDITRDFREDAEQAEDAQSGERVRAKGDVSRHRTIIQDDSTSAAGGEMAAGMPAASGDGCLPGRVLKVHGLYSYVEMEDGRIFRCAVRRLLKSLLTDERSIVTTGDRVWFRPSGTGAAAAEGEATPSPTPALTTVPNEGMIERVEPRHGVLTRASRRREHVLVANVDQLVIVMSLVQPDLKPHLIDRYTASAEKGGLAPIICLNKADLADATELQPLIGAYSQLGIPTVLTSARTGFGVPRLRELLRGRATVFSGQSGVGKSSLLNAVQPDLALRVKTVSDSNQKGRHTTTTAELIRLEFGGWVVDTPGVRQLQLWDTRPEEVEGYLRDFRPFVPLCAFPDCTHTHEARCAVKAAVARHLINDRRYHSYLGMFHGVAED
ncbi:ribosome small subunit-dependent GTPase A [Fimbriiglobus ruber]|uniref:Small ribosomal subunit biogenesis GTPase RsgA n=1 Tax=Fimbriiglobus ruber TaxID=1908690 RepID=A0A225E9G8_9BACT|nr:ribosome small subunit-dependent GTPase A [Fimbriiglobus ruber]OWK45067.1 Ribosome small subunit-stimulated GTPase EngC [Fimbriiglobus ruber]